MKKLAITLATTALLFVGCTEEKQASAQGAKQMPALPVKAYTVAFQTAEFTKSYSAILKPFREVNVVARVSGLLEKENFVEGSLVKKGDLLYEIQKDEYAASLASAKGAYLKAKANNKKASKDWERTSYLFKNKAVSEQQRDDVLYSYEDSQAELQRTRGVLKNAQIEYNYTTIHAPITGIIGMSKSDEGTFIASNNSILTTITALDSVYAEFSIPSSDIVSYMSQIKVGAEVSLKSGGKVHTGIVDYIAPKLDSQTDTLLIRAKFNNKQRELVIGSYVEIVLSGFSYENVAKIPQGTLIKTPDATLVYIIKDSTVSMKPVKVIHVDNGIAIIESGLSEGDKIVSSNIAKLRPNSKVSIIGEK